MEHKVKAKKNRPRGTSTKKAIYFIAFLLVMHNVTTLYVFRVL